MAGTVDRLDNFGMAGWACSDDGQKASRIRVDVNGVPVYAFIPSDYRPDLARAGWAGGNCSLQVRFPKVLALFEPAFVEVWNEDTGTLLSNTGFSLEPAITNAGKYAFETPTNINSACPLTVKYEGGVATVNGIAVYRSNAELELKLVHGNASVISFQQEVEPWRTKLLGNLVKRRFTIKTKSPASAPFSLFQVKPVDHPAGPKDFAGYVAIPSRPPKPEDVPDYENMSRVSGQGITPEIFATCGLTTATKIDGAARSFGGKPLSEFRRILDWGGGVGRVARHVQKHFARKAELWCVDIDDVNVEKAKKYLPDAKCTPIPFYPPTNLPSDYFDFIYGISVFTHLTEDAQEVWLSELRRVTRNGAILIMSTNTEFAAIELGMDTADTMGDLLILGISDRLRDGNLANKLKRENYYRSTLHLTKYIRAEWSKHFDILEIVYRADTHVQDFVIMRRT